MPTIRPLTPADADAYVALRREMLLDSPWSFGASPGSDRGSDPAAVSTSLANPEFAIIGAWDDDQLVASVGVRRIDTPKRRHLAEIWGVYVTPSARNRRVGRGVMQAAIALARSWPGVAGVRLSVSAKANEALRMYESLGFITWGFEPDCIRIEGHQHEPGPGEHHMTLTF